jgi:hypothetical protein
MQEQRELGLIGFQERIDPIFFSRQIIVNRQDALLKLGR